MRDEGSEGLYKNNPKIKASGTPTQFTEEQVKEYIRCSNDPIYFIEHYVKVVSLDKGVVPFILYPYQKRIISAVHNNRFTIAMLFRQAGKSTILAAYILWFTIFNEYKTSCILANKHSQAGEIFGRVRFMYEELPMWIKPGVTCYNKTSLSFDNGSCAFCAASSASAIRGRSCVSGDTVVEVSIDGKIVKDTINNLKDKVKFFATEIKTSVGFKNFSGFISQGIKDVFELKTDDGISLKCTNDHRLKIDSGDYVELMWLAAGDILYGGSRIESIVPCGQEEVYDAYEVEDVHDYETNGLISHNCSLLLADEFAYLPPNIADEFIASVFPTLSSSKESKLVLISTPNGLNHFAKYYKEAEQGINDFVAVRGYYTESRDEAWAEKQLKLLGQVKFNSEVLCSFEGSAFTLVEPKSIEKLITSKPIDERCFDTVHKKNTLLYFKPTIKGHNYAITVDVSRGRDMDFSAFSVFDITAMPYEIVCTFKNNRMSTLEYPGIINSVSRYYNNASVLIENNDLGEAIGNDLWFTFENENVLWTNHGKISGRGIIGVKTTKQVKIKGQSAIKEIIEKGQLIVNDFRILEELSVFVMGKHGSYEAQDTKINDDLMTTLWLFGWFTQTEYFQQITDINTNKSIVEKMREDQMLEDITPVGFSTEWETEVNKIELSEDQKELLMH